MAAERTELIEHQLQQGRADVIDIQTRQIIDRGDSFQQDSLKHESQEVIDEEALFLEGMKRKFGLALETGLHTAAERTAHVDTYFQVDRNQMNGGLDNERYVEYQSRRDWVIGVTTMQTLIDTGIEIQDRRNPDEMTYTAGIIYDRLQDIFSKDPEELQMLADTVTSELNQQALQHRYQA